MYYHSPVGILKINIEEGSVNEILFVENEAEIQKEPSKDISRNDQLLFEECRHQLNEYFAGKRQIFDFAINQKGTPFRIKVWNELMNIPYGKTISYLQLSKNIANVKSIRAVGSANGHNHLPIVVPCHRVIGSDGKLVGYGGGLWRKQWLLEHENKYANGVKLLF
jgi:methylated-DNA-[protein]-cysteine S-methyltransferase